MKTKLSFTMLLCFLLASFTKTNAQKADEEAIKNVIQDETRSFFHKDYDKWADTWSHDSADYIMRGGASGHQLLMGWNAISSSYKESMKNLQMDEESIAPYLNKTDFHIYISGNMASVTFKEGNQNPSPESRTMVKQNGAWKILNMSILENGSYLLADAYNNMKAFVGKWEYENNSFTVEPDNGMKPVMARFEFKETPTGLVQLSDVSYTSNNQSFVVPTECEYFIPDYNQNEIKYMDIQKNTSGQTFTNMRPLQSKTNPQDVN
jgi:hypothetical protein